MWKKIVLVVVSLCTLTAVYVWMTPNRVYVFDGSYPLQLTLTSGDNGPPTAVRCYVTSRYEETNAQYENFETQKFDIPFLEKCFSDGLEPQTKAEPFTGQVLEVNV